MAARRITRFTAARRPRSGYSTRYTDPANTRKKRLWSTINFGRTLRLPNSLPMLRDVLCRWSVKTIVISRRRSVLSCEKKDRMPELPPEAFLEGELVGKKRRFSLTADGVFRIG